jgi:hypothetical protein
MKRLIAIALTVILAFCRAAEAQVNGTSVQFTPPTSCTSTIGINIGNATTGITYGANSCEYSVINGEVTVTFIITLTSIGALTGNVKVTGLPVTSNSGTFSGSAIGIGTASPVSGVTGPIAFIGIAGTQTAYLQMQGTSATSLFSQANITNTTVFVGTIIYYQ